MIRLALLLLAALALPVDAARAEAINIDVATPPIIIVRHSMAQRTSRLERFFAVGVIGLGNDGLLRVRDTTGLKLVQRQIAEKLVDHENNDRKGLMFAIAEAHEGRQARHEEIRAALLRRWQDGFKSGWWMQDPEGSWIRKP